MSGCTCDGPGKRPCPEHDRGELDYEATAAAAAAASEGRALQAEERIALALQVAVTYGGFEGAHHKAWVIDQMVRALTGCPAETGVAHDYRGNRYEYEKQGESAEYQRLVKDAKDGSDGPESYSWDVGVAP